LAHKTKTTNQQQTTQHNKQNKHY